MSQPEKKNGKKMKTQKNEMVLSVTKAKRKGIDGLILKAFFKKDVPASLFVPFSFKDEECSELKRRAYHLFNYCANYGASRVKFLFNEEINADAVLVTAPITVPKNTSTNAIQVVSLMMEHTRMTLSEGEILFILETIS